MSAVIYAAVDPAFGFNLQTLALMLSLAASLGILTAVYDGGQVLLSSRAFGLHAVLRVHPVGVVVALVSVVITRITGLNPGIVLGFIAGAIIISNTAEHDGPIIFVPMVSTLLLCVIGLAVLDPIRELTAESDLWLATVPETVTVAIIVGGIEGLLFSLLPITFMDGKKVWDWNRPAWFVIAVPTTFIFIAAFFNQTKSFIGAAGEAGMRDLFLVALFFVALAAAFWLVCRLTLSTAREEEIPLSTRVD